MTTLPSVIALLEKATEGSEALDIKICRAFFGYGVDQPLWHVMPYTRSLDAALTLIPDWVEDKDIGYIKANGFWSVYLMWMANDFEKERFKDWANENKVEEVHMNEFAKAPAPALALCIAALKAHAALRKEPML